MRRICFELQNKKMSIFIVFSQYGTGTLKCVRQAKKISAPQRKLQAKWNMKRKGKKGTHTIIASINDELENEIIEVFANNINKLTRIWE